MRAKAITAALFVTLPVAVAVALAPAPATASTSGWHAAASRPPLSPLLRQDVTVPAKLPAGAHLRSTALGRTSVISPPATGPAQSSWQVSYTGFDATSNPNGPAAQAAFQAAVNIWSQIVASSVPIKVTAQFAALPSGVLGSAGPTDLYTDGSGVYFASALADAIAGEDVSVAVAGPSADIQAEFTNAAGADWYYGTDGNVPAGDVDFESVVLHELGHGLGFLGDMSVSSGTGGYQVPFAYDEDTYDAASGGSPLDGYTNNSAALATALQSQSVYWGGPAGVQNDGGARPKLYAPSTWQAGSSYSHLDEATYPIGNANSLMTPAISANEVIHDPGPIAVGMLIDEGWQATLPSLIAAPDAPTAVTASAGNAQVTVSWTAPNAHNSAITKYQVTANGSGPSCSTTGATTCTVTGLTNGTSYTFTVTATNAIGTSPVSQASAAVTPIGPPGAPTAVTATSADGAALVQWTAPTSTGGSPITGYAATSTPGSKTCSTTGATSCTVSGLTNGTSYSFTVVAANGFGPGSASSASAAVVPAGVPQAPTNVVATPGNTTADVSWTGAAANGSAVSAYQVTSSPGGLTCSTSGATSCTVPDLTNGTSYTFTVTATNAVGTSAPSSPSLGVQPSGPPATKPDAPVAAPDAVAGDASVTVSWSPPAFDGGQPITGYDVEYSANGYGWTAASASFHSDPTTSQDVTGLTDGTTYEFRVAAVNSLGTGSYSPASSGVTPTAPPADASQLTAGAGRSVTYGHSVTLTAALRDSATSAVLDGPVELLSRTGSANAFADVQSLAGSPTGSLSVTVRPTLTTEYQFFFAGDPRHQPKHSAVITVAVAPAVSVTATRSKVARGHRLELYGAVTPGQPGTVVWLQRKSGSAWKTLAVHAKQRTQTLPNGKKKLGYALRVPTGKTGRASYRVLVKASPSRVAGSSAAKRLRIS